MSPVERAAEKARILANYQINLASKRGVDAGLELIGLSPDWAPSADEWHQALLALARQGRHGR